MFDAIRRTVIGTAAAKREAVRRRIANRPLAHLGAERQHGRRTGLFDIRNDRLADDRTGHHRLSAANARRRRRMRCMMYGLRDRTRRTRRLVQRPCRLRRCGPTRQAQAVHLTDHRIARYAAQCLGDLAGRMTLRPKFLQGIYPLVCPAHALTKSLITLSIAIHKQSNHNI